MMRFDYALLTSLFLSVILLTGTVVHGFLIQEAFAQVLPTMDINDVTAFEGDAGNTNFVFTVSLSSPPLAPVSANFATVEITASSGSDYVQRNGIVSFAVGESAKTITIAVKGDTGIEQDEEFRVRLSNAIGANLPGANEDGTGTILNDDGIPRILINDVALVEGNSGTSTAQFTISLTATHTLPVTVNYATADDSATVYDNDYTMSSGQVIIPAGRLNTIASVVINGDTTFEPNEFFFVNLFAPVNAAFNDNQGRGTILNDDSADILPNAIDDSVTTNEDTSITTNVLANDISTGNAPFTITATHGTKGTTTVNPDNTITYMPNPDQNGFDSYTYTITDADLDTDTATVSVIITSVDDVPDAVDDAATTGEDAFALVDVLSNDSGLGDGGITLAINTQATNGIASVGPGNSITYTPNPDFNGIDSFVYQISDGNGGLATATVLVTVTPVNDPPSAIDDIITTNEDTTETVNVLFNDTDEEGPVTISSIDTPSHGTAVQSGTDSIAYTPNANYFGSDSFTYTIVDSEGAPVTATVSVTILSVNDIPTAMPDAYSTDEDQALVVAIPRILENDSDVETTTLTAILVDNTLQGTLTLSTDGSFIYTPNANYFGSDSFTYRASDGEDTSNITTVTITINSINDLPIAVDDTATTTQNTPVTLPVLGNDSDIEGVLSILSIESSTSGTASVNPDNTITYLPSLGFFGTDSFLYTITDGVDADSATITVTVTESTALFCGLPESSYNVINGSPGNDNLSGTNGADLIRGYGGDDKIKGKKGNDCLIGGDGADKIWGGDGHDTIHGDAGADKLYGDKGDDTTYGGDGNDRLWGGKDNDNLYGEIGYDKIQGGDGNDSLEGGDHNDKIFGGKGNDIIDAGNGNDEVHANQGDDSISGGPGNDWLGAGKGNDVINAGDGNDKLFGRDGDDTLHGQGHDDQIHGGPGNDTIDGGETPNPATDSDRCLGGPGANSIVNCEVIRGGSDDSEEHSHDEYEGEDEEPES
jgi:large repetitive protein